MVGLPLSGEECRLLARQNIKKQYPRILVLEEVNQAPTVNKQVNAIWRHFKTFLDLFLRQ